MAPALKRVAAATLDEMPLRDVAAIVRRIVNNQAFVPTLDVAAFNSSV
jgi:FXSXX-COOH protein